MMSLGHLVNFRITWRLETSWGDVLSGLGLYSSLLLQSRQRSLWPSIDRRASYFLMLITFLCSDRSDVLVEGGSGLLGWCGTGGGEAMVGRGRVHLLVGSCCCAKFALVKVMLQDFKEVVLISTKESHLLLMLWLRCVNVLLSGSWDAESWLSSSEWLLGNPSSC